MEGSEGTALEPHLSPVLVQEQGALAVQMDRSPGRILLGRLQTAGLLSVIERNPSDSVHGEPAQVHLHVLGVVHLDPVQEDAHMLAAEAPYIHRLQAAHASVVLDLDSGEPAEDIRHLRRRRQGAGQIDLLGRPDDRKGQDGVDGRRRKRIRLLGRQAPGGGQGGSQRYDSALTQFNTRQSGPGTRRHPRSSAWRP